MTTFAPTRELRLGIVLYGGVSLAIYMNGVVQQLHHLVRATAPTGPDRDQLPPVEGIEAIYREIACHLRDGRWVADADDEVRTQLVVDLVSGTSAGGINGIFLAKALTSGGTLDSLAKLWVSEGDVGQLLNEVSTDPTKGHPADQVPTSVFSNTHMLYELLSAIDEISQSSAKAGGRSLVDELDLWVTATDLAGRPALVRVDDPGIEELDYRAAFHFAYRSGVDDDFAAPYDPMLAFAARATSSFPLAFEPVRLDDLDPVAKLVADPAERGWHLGGDRELRSFFWRYPVDVYQLVPFADGGYLDDMPFERILDTLPLRRADVPVDRWILYVDPLPGGPQIEIVQTRPPLVDTLVKVGTLPRYETISGEVDRIVDFGRLGRTREVAYDLVDRYLDLADDHLPTTAAQPYLELRAEDTDGDVGFVLGCLLLADFVDPQSPQAGQLTELVAAWRARSGTDAAALQQYLDRFDLTYHLNRVNFVQGRIGQRLRADDEPVTGRGVKERQQLDDVFTGLRAVGRSLRTVPDDAPWLADLRALTVDANGALVAGLAARVQPPNSALAQAMDAAMAALGQRLHVGTPPDLLGIDALAAQGRSALAGDQEALRWWDAFARYDEVIYGLRDFLPGEHVAIPIHRISPADALLSDRGAAKLYGGRFFHFGAFFESIWRQNDILWGRLDGAERLIDLLVPPDAPDRVTLVQGLVERSRVAVLQEALSDPVLAPLMGRITAGHTGDPVATALSWLTSGNDPLLVTEADRDQIARRTLAVTNQVLDPICDGIPHGQWYWKLGWKPLQRLRRTITDRVVGRTIRNGLGPVAPDPKA